MVAAKALGEVAQAGPTLANQMLTPLLISLKDSDPHVRRAAARVLEQVTKADSQAR
ncbi:MAG: HEAT repeat domain-containing protein [Blastocatellia bacterium]